MFYNLMPTAIELAKMGFVLGEVPVGAAARVEVEHDGETIERIFKAHNAVFTTNDPTAHAEILVIRQIANHFGTPRFDHLNITIYTTLEPCMMCAAAISFCRIKKVVFGIRDPKFGFIENSKHQNIYHNFTHLYGFHQDEISSLMKSFFNTKRD